MFEIFIDIPNLHGYERMANETEEKNQEYRLGSPCTIDEELIDEVRPVVFIFCFL